MIRIMVGDTRDVLKTIGANSVQCVVTSPPYYGLRQYLPDGHPDMDKQIGLEASPDEYVAEMVAVFRDVRRVLRDDGVAWINIGDSYAQSGTKTTGRNDGDADYRARTGGHAHSAHDYAAAQNRTSIKIDYGAKPKDLLGIPWQVAFALRADGWYLRSEVIWAKPNPMPESVTDRPTKAHEQVFLLSKSARYFYDADAIAEASDHPELIGKSQKVDYRPDGTTPGGKQSNSVVIRGDTRNARTIWTIATQPYSGAHFATMPPALADRCIKAGTSERGCCPECGAPWTRESSRGSEQPSVAPSDLDRFGTGDAGVHRKVGGQYQKWLDANPKVTTGWAPSCECPPHNPIPCVVLDPFGGAGTTALVADRLGRDATIIELNPEYAALARERITQDAGMFAHVA